MSDTKLTIIIGLPGSGKSHLSNTLSDSIIYDDFISDYYNGKLCYDLQHSNKNVCINDPRMCVPNVFDRFVDKLLKIVKKENIFLILFENNPEQCILNSINSSKNIKPNILEYTKKYNLNHYSNYNNKIIPVYKN